MSNLEPLMASNILSDARIAEIEARCKAAPDGPYAIETVTTQVGHCHKIMPMRACIYVDNAPIGCPDKPSAEARATAELFAHAPTDIDALIASHEALAEKVKQMTDGLKEALAFADGAQGPFRESDSVRLHKLYDPTAMTYAERVKFLKARGAATEEAA